MKLKKKKILVTGGAGFIGSSLVDLLVSKGAFVSVLDNLSTGSIRNLTLSEINFIKGDIGNSSLLNKVINGQDIVFHLAASANVRLSVKDPNFDFQNNVVGSHNVFQACLKSGTTHVIFASSAAVYGEASYLPIDELHPTNPVSPYGAGKLASEKLGMSYFKSCGLPFTIARIFNSYGNRQWQFVMVDLFKKLYDNPEKLEVLGLGSNTRDYCYVTDTAKCLALMAENPSSIGQIYNIASGEETKISELVNLIIKVSGLKNVEVNYTGKSWKGDVSKWIGDGTKAKKELGFEPKIKLEEGIEFLKDYLLSQS